jgi:enoyl-CoA hydratase/carnithine racemase
MIPDPSAKVRFAEENAGKFVLGFIALDNPRALNALDFTMLEAIGCKLLEWRARDEIACIILHSDSERAFSAGGDVKSLAVKLREANSLETAREYFTMEYFVDYLIHIYPKPILCWADGIAMGGGIGIMNGASCRVVTERSVLAMPEVILGLFPDVGATYFLNHIPHGIGLFLGLTSAEFSGYDAVAIGMAEGLARSDTKQAVFSGLRHVGWSVDAQSNKEALRNYLAEGCDSRAEPSSEAWKQRDAIERLTAAKTIDEIDQAFRNSKVNSQWIEGAIRRYLSASPTSIKVTCEQIRSGHGLDLREVYLREWNMALHFCERSDFAEGVRARLIDKDNRPQWNPARLENVRPEEVARYFSPHAGAHPLAEKFRTSGLD